MSDPRVPTAAAGGLLTRLLGLVAGEFLEQHAGDRLVADLLAEWLVALRLHDGLSRGVYPPRGAVAVRSAALDGLEVALADAVRYYRAAAAPPKAVPARLEVPAGAVGRDLQTGGLLAPDEMTLREAAAALGLKSAESVRLLLRSGELEGWQEGTGRCQWHVSRASVMAHRKRKRDERGPGGSTRARVA
jgi:hypothetical protein